MTVLAAGDTDLRRDRQPARSLLRPLSCHRLPGSPPRPRGAGFPRPRRVGPGRELTTGGRHSTTGPAPPPCSSSAIPRRRERLPSAGEPLRVNRPLAGSRSEPDIAPRAREARAEIKDENPEIKDEKARAPRGQSMLPPAGAATLAAVPENRTEALAAAQVMQERARVLRRISAEHLRHLARPFFAAGWSPRDLLRAIDHEPGGRQHGYTSGVRSPAGWNPLTAGRVVRPERCPAAIPQPAPRRGSPPGPRRPGRPPGPGCRRPGSGRGLPGAGRPGTGDAAGPAHRCPRFSPPNRVTAAELSSVLPCSGRRWR